MYIYTYTYMCVCVCVYERARAYVSMRYRKQDDNIVSEKTFTLIYNAYRNPLSRSNQKIAFKENYSYTVNTI